MNETTTEVYENLEIVNYIVLLYLYIRSIIGIDHDRSGASPLYLVVHNVRNQYFVYFQFCKYKNNLYKCTFYNK